MKEIASKKASLTTASGDPIGLRYAIVAEAEPAGRFICEHYGVLVETDTGERELIPDITTSRTRIEELYGLLYRCGVTPITVRDVLEDWL